MKNAFVFVVCGSAEHTDSLNYVLKALKPRTRNDIIVLTDLSRNESPILHDHVIHIPTPGHLNHHQASIFLKTSIHRYLPEGPTYVYLDSDIIAIGEQVDAIFDQFLPPVRFAADHCRMPAFSPYAVNCGCQEEYNAFMLRLNKRLDELDPIRKDQDTGIQAERTKLSKQLSQLLQNKPALVLKGFQYILSYPTFRFNNEFSFNKKTQIWSDSQGRSIMTNIKWGKLARELKLRYNPVTFSVKFVNGKNIWALECDHLPAYIRTDLSVQVKDLNFQHWNGGVFIFNRQSHDFLETWHAYTMEIFKNPRWKTRDQGTLIATIWKYNLEKHPVLDKKWNYICDYHNHLLKFDPATSTITDNGKEYIRPELVHIYHHFGDTTWDLWNWVDSKVPSGEKAEIQESGQPK